MKNSQKESIIIEFRAVVTLGAKVLTESVGTRELSGVLKLFCIVMGSGYMAIHTKIKPISTLKICICYSM